VADFCKHGTEPSGSMKGEGFIDQLNNGQFLKKGSAPWRQLCVI
jgi:hypothetical protein